MSTHSRAAGEIISAPETWNASAGEVVPATAAPRGSSNTGPTADMAAIVPPEPGCKRLDSSERVPARSATMALFDADSTDHMVFTRDLFNLYKSPCGSCHPGPFATWARAREADTRARMHSDDPDVVMPPYAQFHQLWSDRKPDDSIVELASLLDAWYASGAPDDLFYVPAAGARMSVSPYALSEAVGQQLTAIGSCIPDAQIVAREAEQMNRLDAAFAAATDLPPTLDQTDLTSFESETLARSGVISFAPAYPLFSDGARKMRHVRVPRGQSIKFDKATQEFEIPANTRFYKTFFKKVIESDGSEHYRKLETRLIVSRPDAPDASDGSHDTRALFGTYAWDESETSAKLVRDTLRNGQPFLDRLVTYISDEPKAAAALRGAGHDKEEALYAAGASRTYAIPGAVRCVQCHMGSHSRSFVLGFTPLQIVRRATGEGGTYEPSSEDELGQLQRLIDYGVITGIDTIRDVLPLERSQADRAPRNDQELDAQGYMLGNCAHCHNSRGYATVENPVLSDLLNFFPDRAGGVFQFPLERTSPRIKRGFYQDIEIPYITPSLLDLQDTALSQTELYNTPGAGQITPSVEFEPDDVNYDPRITYYMGAPWRSLIYRNVDTPFMYAADYALYPHMPMNTAGFDSRAPRILGDWMVSIPARLRSDLGDPNAPGWERTTTEQPYEEVKPSAADYATALADAQARLRLYHDGGTAPHDYFASASNDPGTEHTSTYFLNYRYTNYEPDTRDIVDHDVLRHSDTVFTPADVSSLPSLHDQPDVNPATAPSPAMSALFARAKTVAGEGVPDRPHWVVTDITDLPPPWFPRRLDWADALVSQRPDVARDGTEQKAEALVLAELSQRTLSQKFRTFTQQPVPLGLWKRKPECHFDKERRVASFTGNERWNWMNSAPADAPVYVAESYGAAVFGEICVNCHGTRFDSRGRQADNLMLITGGNTRVANLRDGLFGPIDDPGAYRKSVFGPYANDALTYDDWAARYVAWMALGGTLAKIDPVILRLVSNATVLGVKRPGPSIAGDANMLSLAAANCKRTLPTQPDSWSPRAISLLTGLLDEPPAYLPPSPLITTNGDAELWQRLCAVENPRPIYVTARLGNLAGANSDAAVQGLIRLAGLGLYDPSTFPDDGTVGDDQNQVRQGLSSVNTFPWCVPAPRDDTEKMLATKIEARRGTPLPLCPSAWFPTSSTSTGQAAMTVDDLERWKNHGAINAGMAVFLYLDKRSHDALQGKDPAPDYDDCELIQESNTTIR